MTPRKTISPGARLALLPAPEQRPAIADTLHPVDWQHCYTSMHDAKRHWSCLPGVELAIQS